MKKGVGCQSSILWIRQMAEERKRPSGLSASSATGVAEGKAKVFIS
ncbi:hypothetical protein QUB80_00235 [Chlorogloeopsis sp. ULAP01]|nr:hypothetical protein [Chlorogloeopsis sp. ULAP01]MDM9379136.1 hypothetical protein [Chlorogloeopsis sp. ULAP01]